jgi:hypothetical protein
MHFHDIRSLLTLPERSEVVRESETELRVIVLLSEADLRLMLADQLMPQGFLAGDYDDDWDGAFHFVSSDQQLLGRTLGIDFQRSELTISLSAYDGAPMHPDSPYWDP